MQACLVVHLPIILIVTCPKLIIEHFLQLFSHWSPFIFTCQAIPHVLKKTCIHDTCIDILFTLPLWFPIDYGSILSSVTMCLLFFVLIRAMVSPCFQFGCLNFLACNLWLNQSFDWQVVSLLCYIFSWKFFWAISFCKFPLKTNLMNNFSFLFIFYFYFCCLCLLLKISQVIYVLFSKSGKHGVEEGFKRLRGSNLISSSSNYVWLWKPNCAWLCIVRSLCPPL